jgi:hypothetical protein
MPKRSKSSSRRANLAKLRHEYYVFKKRSEAAKRGWVTRRLRELGIEPPPLGEVTIERLKYKPSKGGRMLHIEIERVGTRITRISIGNKSYTTRGDIQAFSNVLEHAELDD